jgi:hypothetical protein
VDKFVPLISRFHECICSFLDRSTRLPFLNFLPTVLAVIGLFANLHFTP